MGALGLERGRALVQLDPGADRPLQGDQLRRGHVELDLDVRARATCSATGSTTSANKLPYDDFDAYWNQSPLKYIKNAKTPTMIHVVEGDPRVPSPQSIELHMALKQLNVPTELFLYPGTTHGIPDPRNQLVKAQSEMAWMDYYVRGQGKKFSWRDVLKTLGGGEAEGLELTIRRTRGEPLVLFPGGDFCLQLPDDRRLAALTPAPNRPQPPSSLSPAAVGGLLRDDYDTVQ